MPICLLVRHGRTTANTSGVLAGWTPQVHLDDEGQDAIAALGRRLAGLPIARLVSSPLERCRASAAGVVVHGRLTATVDIEPDLAECRYGAWTGARLGDLAADPLWRVVQDHPSAACFPDGADFPGESLAAMSARAVAAVRRIDREVEAAHGADAVWVAVSHGDVIKAVLADAAGTHLDHFQRFVVAPASISVVRYTSTRPFLERVNDTGADLAALVPAQAEGSDDAGGSAAGSDRRRADGDAVVGGGL